MPVVAHVERNTFSLAQHVTRGYFFAVYKILLFSFSKLRSKDTFDKVCGALSKFYACATMKAFVQ